MTIIVVSLSPQLFCFERTAFLIRALGAEVQIFETRGGRCNSNARIRYPILSLTLHVQRLPRLVARD